MAQGQSKRHTITLIPGDGVGPEVTGAARRIIDAIGLPIDWEVCEAGAEPVKRGILTGLPHETIESIQRTGVVLKGPLETPIGYGAKSTNVTIRKLFETYANVRPVVELPGIASPYAGLGVDIVVVRENVEDLYAGIEHMQTPSVAQCLKLISQKGCEKVIRLAFEFAVAQGRKTLHCATKANIMKLTEGLFKREFERIAPEYPGIEAKHIIIDNCAHWLVRHPESFDVIVTTNMNGDILSDLTSSFVGGLGVAPSANIGNKMSMFEAVHGSAPDIAGKGLANPTAVILSSVMMLRHLGELAPADTVEQALVATLEQRVFTPDLATDGKGVSTDAFTDTVIKNLGTRPERWTGREHKVLRMPEVASDIVTVTPRSRRQGGVDVFIESPLDAVRLGQSLDRICSDTPLLLKMISNRGTVVYPPTGTPTDCVDHWRCRFVARAADADLADDQILDLVQRIGAEHRWMHLEKLQWYDDERAYTMAQGES